MLKYLTQIWNAKDLRFKILFTLGMVVIFRLISHVTIPGIDTTGIKAIFAKNQVLGVFSALTGGSMENFSIVLMGLSPYINASIIIQLLTVIFPRLEAMQKDEGEQGRQKLNMYTRLLTVPMAFIQSYGMIYLLNSQSQVPLISNIGDLRTVLPIMLVISAGSLLLMWLGELISEKGIGNGVSVLIFVGIISNIPTIVAQILASVQNESDKIGPAIGMLLGTILLTIIIILVSEGYRRIPIAYAGQSKRGASQQSMLPLRINMVGMIPIIFAISLITFPSILAQFFANARTEWLKNAASFILENFQKTGPIYLTVYFLLIIGFTFFYTSITFQPDQVADNIQKRGGFVPGFRPGKQTAEHLAAVSNRLTLWGGIFVGFIAVSPMLIQQISSEFSAGSVPLLMSGAGMLIVVGVVLELIRQVNAQLAMHNYEQFY